MREIELPSPRAVNLGGSAHDAAVEMRRRDVMCYAAGDALEWDGSGCAVLPRHGNGRRRLGCGGLVYHEMPFSGVAIVVSECLCFDRDKEERGEHECDVYHEAMVTQIDNPVNPANNHMLPNVRYTGAMSKPKKRLTIELLPEEESLLREVRVAAIRQGMTMRDWVLRAVRMAYEREQDERGERTT